MIHFIRNAKNDTIVDIQADKDDIICVVNILYYSLFLLSVDKSRYEEIIADFNSRHSWNLLGSSSMQSFS